MKVLDSRIYTSKNPNIDVGLAVVSSLIESDAKAPRIIVGDNVSELL